MPYRLWMGTPAEVRAAGIGGGLGLGYLGLGFDAFGEDASQSGGFTTPLGKKQHN